MTAREYAGPYHQTSFLINAYHQICPFLGSMPIGLLECSSNLPDVAHSYACRCGCVVANRGSWVWDSQIRQQTRTVPCSCRLDAHSAGKGHVREPVGRRLYVRVGGRAACACLRRGRGRWTAEGV